MCAKQPKTQARSSGLWLLLKRSCGRPITGRTKVTGAGPPQYLGSSGHAMTLEMACTPRLSPALALFIKQASALAAGQREPASSSSTDVPFSGGELFCKTLWPAESHRRYNAVGHATGIARTSSPALRESSATVEQPATADQSFLSITGCTRAADASC